MISDRHVAYYKLPTRLFLVWVLLQHFSEEVARIVFSFFEWGDTIKSSDRAIVVQDILDRLTELSKRVAEFTQFLRRCKSVRYVRDTSKSPVLKWWPYDYELYSFEDDKNVFHECRRGLVVKSQSPVFSNLRNYAPPLNSPPLSSTESEPDTDVE